MEHRMGYLVAAFAGAVVTAAIYEVSGAFADAAAVLSNADVVEDTDVVATADADDDRRRERARNGEPRAEVRDGRA